MANEDFTIANEQMLHMKYLNQCELIFTLMHISKIPPSHLDIVSYIKGKIE